MIKAIIFDLFGVLYSEVSVIAMNQLAGDHDAKLEADFFRLSVAGDRGMISEGEYVEAVARLLGITPQEWLETKRKLGGSQKDQAVFEFINDLRKNYKTAVLSNIGTGQIGNYIVGDDCKSFDVMLGSGDIGAAKPEPAAFHAVLARLEVSASEAVFVDDTPSNVEGANKLGLHGVHYTTLAKLKADLHKLFESV